LRDTTTPTAKPAADPSRLRVVRGKPVPAAKGKRTGRGTSEEAPRKARRRPRGPVSVRDEILRHGGARGDRRFQAMAEASEAYDEGRERDAVRILRPLVKAMPGAPSVRELLGLALYRSGQYPAAAEQLEAYVAITGEVDQHPVLMDCARARRDHDRVDELWRELAEVSPGAALVTEGRIVLAGSLADRGRLKEAIALLSRRADTSPKRVQEHHLRLWYALADLEERAGKLPRARTLFDRVRRQDASFADVAERLAALG
jgi:tetratricopeptide (TPR) repeat protein